MAVVGLLENKRLVRRLIEEGLNENNPDVADGHFTDDYVAHIPGLPDDAPRGPEAFKQVIRIWRGAFSDWHMTIEELIGEGDFVANRFTTTGTHDGPLFGIPPTGNRMVVHSLELHRISTGKIAESWIVDDVPGILVQLGIGLNSTPGRPPAQPR
jgi:predicted ester cyclase